MAAMTAGGTHRISEWQERGKGSRLDRDGKLSASYGLRFTFNKHISSRRSKKTHRQTAQATGLLLPGMRKDDLQTPSFPYKSTSYIITWRRSIPQQQKKTACKFFILFKAGSH